MLNHHDDLDPILRENHTLGRILTSIICYGMVMITIFTVSTVISSQGIGASPTRLIRLVLTCVLAYGIMIGSPAARWLWVGLAGLNGIVLLAATAPMLAYAGIGGVLVLLVAIFYIASAILLAVPSPVSRYVRYRRMLRDL